MTIWKFPLPVDDVANIAMPIGARILCLDVQDELPCIWALVDPKAEQVARRFLTFGTGRPVDDSKDMAYLGTYQLARGNLAFHVFEESI